MFYIAYLIIVDGHNMKKISFENFHYGAAEAGKLHKQVVSQPLGTPPPTPK